MMSKFIQLVVQQKASGDYRAFLHCQDWEGNDWELRGYGSNALFAVENVMDKFADVEWWDSYGYVIEKEENTNGHN